MENYHFLLDIGLILISTKLFGIITRSMRLPQVVGALFAGILLGPAVLNLIKETEFIHSLAQLGVIVLLFEAGLETDISELKKTGSASFIVAALGIVVSLLGGFLLAYAFNGTELFTSDKSMQLLQNVFLGVVITSTSVSIGCQVLKEMGKLSTQAGNTILGAAIIDDMLGLIGLTIIISFASPNVNIFMVLLKIATFLALAVVLGYFLHRLFEKWVNKHQRDMRRFVVTSFAFCLILAYIAERYFGVSDITGAFIAGLVVSNTNRTHYISKRFEISSYMLLSPIFFASIGLSLKLGNMSFTVILFTILLTLVAIFGKLIGCGLGAKLCKYSTKKSLQIGSGMISRGEVTLIIATKGLPLGLIQPETFGPIIIAVVITAIVTSIMLKITFKDEMNSAVAVA